MSIKNFGLMWERNGVQWNGVRGNAGHLSGFGPIGSPKREQHDVDFREQIGVYILYRNSNVVYVGQAGVGDQTLYSRLKDHTVDHLANRWERFSWFGVKKVNQNGSLSAAQGQSRQINAADMLNLLEGLLINVVEPPLNKQGARWGNIHQYYQKIEGWDNWTDKDLLIAIAEKQGIDADQ